MQVTVSDGLAQDQKSIVLIISQGETKPAIFEEHFETLPAWTESGNIPGIDWTIESGALKGTYIVPSGYSFFTLPSLNIASLNEVAVEFDMRYRGSANKGGIYYINTSQYGWRDSSRQFFKPGLSSRPHQVKLVIRQANPYPLSHLYIDGHAVFTNQSIQVSSFSNNAIGFTSPYDKGTMLVDNFSVVE